MRYKLTSRKFWLTLAAVVTALCAAAAGEQPWAHAIWQALAAILAYLGVEGAVDIKRAGSTP